MFTRLLALLLLPHLSSSSTPVPGATDLAAAINAAASLTSSSFVLDPDTLYQGVTVDILRNHDSFACEILCSDLFQQCKISGGGTTRVFYVYGENKEQSGVFTHLSGLVVMDGYGGEEWGTKRPSLHKRLVNTRLLHCSHIVIVCGTVTQCVWHCYAMCVAPNVCGTQRVWHGTQRVWHPTCMEPNVCSHTFSFPQTTALGCT